MMECVGKSNYMRFGLFTESQKEATEEGVREGFGRGHRSACGNLVGGGATSSQSWCRAARCRCAHR